MRLDHLFTLALWIFWQKGWWRGELHLQATARRGWIVFVVISGVGTCWIKDSKFFGRLISLLCFLVVQILVLRRLIIDWRVISILFIGLLKEKVVPNVLTLLLGLQVLMSHIRRVLERTTVHFLWLFPTFLFFKEGIVIRAFPGLLFWNLFVHSNIFHHSFQALFNGWKLFSAIYDCIVCVFEVFLLLNLVLDVYPLGEQVLWSVTLDALRYFQKLLI